MKIIFYFMAFLAAATAHSKDAKKNSVGLELLGRGFLYSMFYERSLADSTLQAGIGVSFLENPIFPVYINMTINENDVARTYLTAGVLITDPERIAENSRHKNNNGIYKFGIPMGGIGMSAHLTDSISLRATGYAYVFLGQISMILPWVGGSIVYDF